MTDHIDERDGETLLAEGAGQRSEACFKFPPLPVRFGLSLVLILPVLLLLLLPEAILDTAANQLGGDRGALLWWGYAVQLFSFIARFASVIVSNGMRIGWAFVIAALKSVFFAVLVGVPFCVDIVFLTAPFLPGGLVWLQAVACVAPTTALVLGISFWFARGLPRAVSKAA